MTTVCALNDSRGRGCCTNAGFESAQEKAGLSPGFFNRMKLAWPACHRRLRYQLNPAPPLTVFSLPENAAPSDTLARVPTARW